MSSQKTPNVGLHRWVRDDKVLTNEFNDNFTKIDNELSKLRTLETKVANIEKDPFLGNGDIDCGTF